MEQITEKEIIDAIKDSINEWKHIKTKFDYDISDRCYMCDISMSIYYELKKQVAEQSLQIIHPCKICPVAKYNKRNICTDISSLVDKSLEYKVEGTINKNFLELRKQVLSMGEDLLSRFNMDEYKKWLKELLSEHEKQLMNKKE